MDVRVSQYVINSEISQDELKPASRISQYIVNAEVWEKPLYEPPNPIISQFIVMAEVEGDFEGEVEKSFNIYLGTTPISKIYLGLNEITNAIY